MGVLENLRLRSRFQLPVLKLVSGSVVRARVESQEVFWAGTHWFNGRQQLCVSDERVVCCGCLEQTPRLVGFVIVTVENNGARRPFLFEFGTGAWARVEFLCEMEGWQATAGLELEVRKGSKHAPLKVSPVSFIEVPMNEELRSWRRQANAVAVLYRLPLVVPDESWVCWLERTMAQRQSILAAAVRSMAS